MSKFPTVNFSIVDSSNEIWSSYPNEMHQNQQPYYHIHHFGSYQCPNKISPNPAISYYSDRDFCSASTPTKRLKGNHKPEQAFLKVNTDEFHSEHVTASFSGGSASDAGSSHSSSFSFYETHGCMGSSIGLENIEDPFRNRQKRIVANERERNRMHK